MDYVEEIAKALHEGWRQYMEAQGVVHDAERSANRHPHLVHWSELTDDEVRNQDRLQASLILAAWRRGEISKDNLPEAIHENWVICKEVQQIEHPHALPYSEAHANGELEHSIQAELVWPLLPVLKSTQASIDRALSLADDRSQLVVASGCFDLLHVGHIRHLEAARALGSALVVLVSDDDSVAELKGEGRPIVPARQRAEVLEALSSVDAAIVHRQCELIAVIRSIHPAVFAKGADTKSFSYEQDIARLGPRVVRVCEGEAPGIHTADLIERARAPQDRLR